jgi:hypothetical protein
MGCDSSSAQAYESCGAPAQGLYSYPGGTGGFPGFDDNQYAIVARRNKPAGAPASFAAVCEAMLRARGIIYWKNNPGDCPAPVGASGFGSGQIVGLSGHAASGILGGLGAAGVLSGPATLGIGTAVSLAVAGITDIFAHHAQAVANEQSTICQVAGYFNPLVKQLDSAVATGQISPSQGISYMQQICQQAASGLAGIMKSCNAACVYQGVLRAFADLASYFYPAIAPAAPIQARPGQAPDGAGTLPGGVLVTSGNAAPAPPVRTLPANTYAPTVPNSSRAITSPYNLPGPLNTSSYLNTGYNQQTGQSAQAMPVSPVDWTMWAAIATIIVAIIAVIGILR